MSVPPVGSRGPRRPLGVSEDELAALIALARQQGEAVEAHRQAMLGAAAERQATVRRLHDAGLSVRRIAAALDVSAKVIQDALARARSDAPPVPQKPVGGR